MLETSCRRRCATYFASVGVRLVDVGDVAKERVIACGAEQLLADPPVRRRAELAPRRDVERRAVERLEPVLAHHLGRVDRLGGRELRVVAVAHAVAPAQREALDQEAALRVLDDLLGHLVRRRRRELLRPERDEVVPRAGVRVLVEMEALAPAGLDEPRGVHRRGRPGRDVERHRGAVVLGAVARDEVRVVAALRALRPPTP